MTPRERVDGVIMAAVGRDLTSWERHKFLPSLRERDTLSERQEELLAGIEARVYNGDEI